MGIILARHGQTKYNLLNKFQGVSDSELTISGIQQARTLSCYLQNKPISKIISSPLKRSLDTSDIVAKALNLNVTIEYEIREICYGEWEEQTKESLKTTDLWRTREKDRYSSIHPGAYKTISGESYSILYNRIHKYAIHMYKLLEDANFTLILSHQGVMLCFYKFFQGLSENDCKDLRIENNEIAILEKKKSNITFETMLL